MICFLFFICIANFGVLNILMGVIFQQIDSAANENAERLQLLKHEWQQKRVQMIQELFVSLDQDNVVTQEEFLEFCQNDNVQAVFDALELPVQRQNLALRL